MQRTFKFAVSVSTSCRPGLVWNYFLLYPFDCSVYFLISCSHLSSVSLICSTSTQVPVMPLKIALEDPLHNKFSNFFWFDDVLYAKGPRVVIAKSPCPVPARITPLSQPTAALRPVQLDILLPWLQMRQVRAKNTLRCACARNGCLSGGMHSSARRRRVSRRVIIIHAL